MLNTSVVRRTTTAALALSLSVGLMACNPPKAPVVSNITSVTVSAAKTSLVVGETTQATANVTVTNNAAKTVTYSTSNPSVATVSATGLIEAKAVGTTTITATSTVDTSKKGTVAITVTAAPVGGTLTTAKINFQRTSSATPTGYTPNTGAAYDAATGIGWVTEASVSTTTPAPLDMTPNSRDRGAINGVTDSRLYTQINMQCNTPTSGNPCATSGGVAPQLTSGAFQHKVANGTYSIKVSVGDADINSLNSAHQIRVEGTAMFATPFVPSAAKLHAEATKTITVSDGMLTVDAIGGQNTKINYIDITPAP